MIPLKQAVQSSIGKKLFTALTGLGLVIFMASHLWGNIKLYQPSGEAFNRYTLGLSAWGPILYVAEVGLALTFLVHIVNGILLTLNNKKARGGEGYKSYRSKGGPTRSNLSSRSMAISGVVLMIFLIWHIIHFKFGPGVAQGYVTQLDGQPARDLHRLVSEEFHKPLPAFLYLSAMIFLGLHLRHGFWSMFQSLGAMNPRVSAPIYCLGVLLAILMAAGFLFIPIYFYFDVPSFF